MEEWLQTEWPHLQVRLTSVTEQWHTFPVVGPQVARRRRRGVRRPGRQQRRVPVHGVARHHARRGARAGRSGQLLRRTRLRGQRHGLVRDRGVGAADRRRRAPRHHPVRHRDDARAARREGLPDHRAGHRRHHHPAGSRHELGGVEEEARLHRQAVVHPQREPQPAAQAVRRAAAPRRGDRAARRARRSSRPSPTANCRRRRCRCSGTSRRATAAPNWVARSRSPCVKGGHARIGDTLHVPVDGTLVAVEVTGSSTRWPRAAGAPRVRSCASSSSARPPAPSARAPAAPRERADGLHPRRRARG